MREGLEVARVVQANTSFNIPPQVYSWLLGSSREGLFTRTVFALTYGAGLFMGYRFLRSYVSDKMAEVREHSKLRHRLWQLLIEWNSREDAGPSEFTVAAVDSNGIVTHKTSNGRLVYFRKCPFGMALPSWEWSRDGVKWIPTSDLKELEVKRCTCSGHCSHFPSQADKTFILGLEVERRMRLGESEGAERANVLVPQPPALEIPDSLEFSPARPGPMDVPDEFLCPMTLRIMTEPVITPSGITYNRPALLHWISSNRTDPATGVPLEPAWLIPNLTLRDIIQKWLVGYEESCRHRRFTDGGDGVSPARQLINQLQHA